MCTMRPVYFLLQIGTGVVGPTFGTKAAAVRRCRSEARRGHRWLVARRESGKATDTVVFRMN